MRDGDFTALRQLPVVELEASVKASRAGGKWVLTAELHNSSKTPALMVRLKPVRGKTGDRILPVLFSDNYFALMPGESRSVRIEMNAADCRGESPRLEIGGFNARANFSK